MTFQVYPYSIKNYDKVIREFFLIVRYFLAFASICTASTATAAPIILDFDGSARGSVAEQSGYQFSVGSGVYTQNGYRSLFASDAGAVSTLTRVDNGVFDLLSILLKHGDRSLDITFSGQLANGETIFQRYQSSNANIAGETATLAGFTNLTSVSFAQGFAGRNAYAFDLVEVLTAVPEPATWAMMLVGFSMVGAASRYRRRRTSATYA